MREEDLADVAAIESTVYAFPWTLGNFRDSLAAGYRCTTAWMGRELVAYAVVMQALDEAHLLNIAVAAPWQGKGIGDRYMRQLIDSARAERLDMLFLEVRPSNVVGRHLYERLGFKQLGIRRDYYPAATGREDALFMGLNLSARQ
ncbi:MAG: ribosomal protein S18-alanine N-acetyltransferase [Betaproteobacteria bacterium]|nr:ribosomal protein S18-alanine N-acetyltransferase [Betaproteobacteria bacterium]